MSDQKVSFYLSNGHTLEFEMPVMINWDSRENATQIENALYRGQEFISVKDEHRTVYLRCLSIVGFEIV
ncbi:hypothetical protein [Faecalibaculum rodentium]|uniref:hypothetical protein n=1 Tax=Faecalibaculum rodentium TaxID=1702221 RepID=UPI0025B6BC73|nr:hypothetical protein [Faecalibaculum rodentium]